MKLIPITVIAMAIPGKNDHHQLPRMRYSCELDRAVPQVVSVALTPRLRKLTNASRTIALATIRVADTMIGPSALGSMWRNVIRWLLTPTALAAITYSCSRRDRNRARTSRANPAHDRSPKI